ncbi:hypothetical protein [uncultured Vibrio sp.]|uniref:IS66 family insertion sequence element accessory protein TnpA n=1 Tax=uncultured Vibrio sp. TaxID=114054 RepID=UPI002629FD29|nr:hypothetical protein [uncultured Vibrio sp.]
MEKRHTNQEWQMLIEQSKSSSLSTLAFCMLNELNPSTFYAKRQQLNKADVYLGFVRTTNDGKNADVVEKRVETIAPIAISMHSYLVTSNISKLAPWVHRAHTTQRLSTADNIPNAHTSRIILTKNI